MYFSYPSLFLAGVEAMSGLLAEFSRLYLRVGNAGAFEKQSSLPEPPKGVGEDHFAEHVMLAMAKRGDKIQRFDGQAAKLA